VRYTPAAGYFGLDSFQYTVKDNAGQASNTATVRLTVSSVTDAPVAVDDGVTTAEDAAVTTVDLTGNDVAGDGTIVRATLAITQEPTNGTAVSHGDGTVTYTPKADFNGTDTFKYKVSDDLGATSNEATVTVTVTAVDDSPVAKDDSGTTTEDTAVVVDVVGNDTDDGRSTSRR